MPVQAKKLEYYHLLKSSSLNVCKKRKLMKKKKQLKK